MQPINFMLIFPQSESATQIQNFSIHLCHLVALSFSGGDQDFNYVSAAEKSPQKSPKAKSMLSR